MKSRIAVIFMFAMLFGTQLHAQSLLEKIGHMVENRVKNDIKKKINKKSQTNILTEAKALQRRGIRVSETFAES